MSIFDPPTGPAATTSTSTVAAPTPPVNAPIPIPRSIFDDPAPQPGIGSEIWNDYAKPGLKLAARVPLHTALWPMDLGVGAAQTVGGLLEKAGLAAPTPTLLDTDGKPLTGPDVPPHALPSQDLINNLGLTMDPDAGLPMRIADAGLPMLFSGGRSKIQRVAEAPGVVPKLAEIGGHVVGAGVDLGLQTLGGMAGNYLGGPEGAFIGSMFGGSLRPGGQQALGWVARRGLGQKGEAPEPGSGEPGLPSSQDVFDSMMNREGPNTMPSFGQVSNDTGKRLEKAVGSFPVLNWGVDAARNAAEKGILDSIATGTGITGNRPASTHPVDEAASAQRIIDLSREANASQQGALSAEEQALEDAIGKDRATPVSPLVDLISGMANRGPGPISRVMNPRVADLYNTISPGETDPTDITSPYGDLKILRSDLGAKTVTTDPIKGPAYNQAYGGYTDAMRGGAEAAGQGPRFDQANLDYSTFKQVNQPWLERQGGNLDRPEQQGNPVTVGGRIQSIAGDNPNYLHEIEAQLGPGAARSTVADVLSRLGRVSGNFTPSKWAQEYGGLSPNVNDFVARNAPEAVPYFNNATTGARAFDIAPERPGLSKSMGWLASLAQMAAEHPALVSMAAPALETPSVIRSMAGRQDIPAILAQYFARQGLAAGR